MACWLFVRKHSGYTDRFGRVVASVAVETGIVP